MEDTKSNVSVSNNQKFYRAVLILVPVLLVTSVTSFLLRKYLSIFPALLMWLIFSIGTIILVVRSRKFYNWIFIFLVLIFTAFYLRTYRVSPWQLLLVIGFSGIASISFYSAFYFLKKFYHNKFLRYIGFFSGIILTSIFLGQLWKIMHWPGGGILQTAGVILFTPYLFAFMLLLPGSDYVNWSKPDRIIFFRVIIIPMIFIWSLIIVMYVLPGIWQSLRSPIVPFGMYNLELLDKPGI